MTSRGITSPTYALERLHRLPLRSVHAVTLPREFLLHVMLASCGHSIETSTSYCWDGTRRGNKGFAALQLTLDGTGRIDTPDGSFDLTPGTLMVVHIPSQHRYYLPRDSPNWEFVYVTAHGRELLRIVRGIVQRRGNVIPLRENSRVPRGFLSILRTSFSSSPLSPFEISSVLYDLCMGVLAESHLEQPRTHHSRLEELKSYLSEHLELHLTVSEMADFVFLSRSHFTRLFKEQVGMSPGRYVDNLRINRALQLLYNDTMTVKEISYTCGIRDVNYFCRMFKKEMGVSPGEYRRSGT